MNPIQADHRGATNGPVRATIGGVRNREFVYTWKRQSATRRRRNVARTPSSSPDPALTRIAKGMGEMRGILDALTETAELAAKKADRAQIRVDDVEIKQAAQATDIKLIAQRQEAGFGQIIAQSTNSYREFMKELSAFRVQVEALEAKVESASTLTQENHHKLDEMVPENIAKAAEGGAKGVIMGQSKDAVQRIIDSKWIQLIGVSSGVVAFLAVLKDIPDAANWIGKTTVSFWTWVIGQRGIKP